MWFLATFNITFEKRQSVENTLQLENEYFEYLMRIFDVSNCLEQILSAYARTVAKCFPFFFLVINYMSGSQP